MKEQQLCGFCLQPMKKIEEYKYECKDCGLTRIVDVLNECTVTTDKPVSSHVWTQKRMLELSEYIHAYIDMGDYEPIGAWIDELKELINKVGE